MKKIIGLIVLGITYTIILGSLLLGNSYDVNDTFKLLIIIIISIIDIMAPIISKLVFGIENKKDISFPKLILNICMLITTIVWWKKIEYFSYVWVMVILVTLRILLVIIELLMLFPKKTNKGGSNAKNKNPVIKPVIQLVGYIIFEIAFLTGNYLILVMPIAMLIVDIIMLVTNKKIINLIKFIISVILLFAIIVFGGLALESKFSFALLHFIIILEGVIQIILNVIEIINVLPILRRNIKKILIITLGIIILCIICVKVNIVNLEYDIYQEEIEFSYYSDYDNYDNIREKCNNTITITSKDEFDTFIDNELKLREEIIYKVYGAFYNSGLKKRSKIEIYKLDETVKEAIDKLKMYKQNIELELGIDEKFFDKYNVIYGIDLGKIKNVTSVKYNRIKNKIFVKYKRDLGVSTGTTRYCEYFIKIDKKYDAPVEWKALSALFSR